jgi:transcriptional regulator with GAF, ATPase, and Fis domain
MEHCAAKQIPMVFVKYAYNESKQAFVRLKDRNAVLSFGQCAKRAQILATLKQTKWVLSGPNGAAVRLGLTPSTLQFRMRKLGIARPI